MVYHVNIASYSVTK